MNALYGPVPVAFLKLLAGKTTQFEIGSLPTLMGAESTFTYQNFNIERGIVWNQENAINRGIQINQTLGKYLTASISWNDGYYSNRYSWLSGSMTLTKGPSTLVYDGMGNLGQTVFETAADLLVAFTVDGESPLILDPGCGSGARFLCAHTIIFMKI